MTVGMLCRLNAVRSLGAVIRTPSTAEVTHLHTSELTVTQAYAPLVTRIPHFCETVEVDVSDAG
jgi:hypothetical protein